MRYALLSLVFSCVSMLIRSRSGSLHQDLTKDLSDRSPTPEPSTLPECKSDYAPLSSTSLTYINLHATNWC